MCSDNERYMNRSIVSDPFVFLEELSETVIRENNITPFYLLPSESQPIVSKYSPEDVPKSGVDIDIIASFDYWEIPTNIQKAYHRKGVKKVGINFYCDS